MSSSLGSKNTQKTQAQTVSTPTPAPFLSQGYQDLASGARGLLNTNPQNFITPANANQTQAFARAGAGTGSPTAGLLDYRAPTITPGQLASTDLSPYMNPYTNDVIDTTIGDATRANAIGLNQLRSSTPTGAFNGSRQGVAEGTFTSDNARNLAGIIAQLRSGNFTQAQEAAKTDIGNRLSADTTNAANDITSAGVRQNAGLLGAQNTRADTAAMLDAGDRERAIAQENNPATAQAKLLELYAQLMNMVPTGAFTGQTGSSSGTTTTSSNPGLLDIAATIAKIASSFATPGQ